MPPRDAWLAELSKAREAAKKLDGSIAAARENDRTHTEIQIWLRDLGLALGYKVWVAANDRGRTYDGGMLSAGCLDSLPPSVESLSGVDSIRLIDILWIDSDSERVSAAFEVEHTTSIYSGIVRMLDLALSSNLHATGGLFLVAPDARQEEVRTQLRRPAFSRVSDLQVRFLPYGELEKAQRGHLTVWNRNERRSSDFSLIMTASSDAYRPRVLPAIKRPAAIWQRISSISPVFSMPRDGSDRLRIPCTLFSPRRAPVDQP